MRISQLFRLIYQTSEVSYNWITVRTSSFEMNMAMEDAKFLIKTLNLVIPSYTFAEYDVEVYENAWRTLSSSLLYHDTAIAFIVS